MTTKELVYHLIEGLNVTDSEAERSGYIARSFAHDGLFTSSIVEQSVVGRQALLQLLQRERWNNHGTKIKPAGEINVDGNNFELNCSLIDANNIVLATGSMVGKTTKSNDLLQEVILTFELTRYFDSVHQPDVPKLN